MLAQFGAENMPFFGFAARCGAGLGEFFQVCVKMRECPEFTGLFAQEMVGMAARGWVSVARWQRLAGSAC